MPVKILTLLFITLVLVTGCITPVPTDTPAVVQTTGSVEVSSTPPGAEVYLDNVYKGTTPVTIIDQPGSHILELRLRDYQSWSKSIQIVTGTKIYVDTALAPVPVVTSLPTSVQTTRPIAVPTTRPRLVTTPTTPVTPQPDFNLTGTYQGSSQDSSVGQGTPFTITFTYHNHGSLLGIIGPHEEINFCNDSARIQGNVDGNDVIFNVIHNTTGSSCTSITIWKGVYDPGSRQINGRWYIGISGGSFVIYIT